MPARAAGHDIGACEIVHELDVTGHVLDRDQERAKRATMQPQETIGGRDHEHPIAVDCRVNEHPRSANDTDACHVSEMVDGTPQLGVRRGLSAAHVASAQGVQQNTVAGNAAELSQKLSALGLRVIAPLRYVNNPVDATAARPRPHR